MQEEKEINIQKHNLVPKHIKLTPEEKEKLLTSLNISASQLPAIFQKDPAIKEFNAMPSDVFKIIRNSPTSSEAIFYRVVVHG